MKKLLGAAAAAAALFALTGCGLSTQPMGLVYTDATLPVLAQETAGATKIGTATCTDILHIVATGDCSIAAAAKNGGITQIQSVDNKVMSILGLYSTFTTTVTGR